MYFALRSPSCARRKPGHGRWSRLALAPDRRNSCRPKVQPSAQSPEHCTTRQPSPKERKVHRCLAQARSAAGYAKRKKERNTQAFVKLKFVPEPKIAEHLSIIRGIDDDGVAVQAQASEGRSTCPAQSSICARLSDSRPSSFALPRVSASGVQRTFSIASRTSCGLSLRGPCPRFPATAFARN